MRDQRIRQAHAAILVDRQGLRARDQRGGFVIEAGGEKCILTGEARSDAVEQILAERIQGRIDETGADIDAVCVLGDQEMAMGRGNAYPPLAVERAWNRRKE